MIPQETVQKIYDAANIVDVIQDFISLKRAGVNYKGLCPFHGEKTPSFVVSPAKNIYKCFGCGAGGDPVKFIREHEKISFPESLRYLAKKYNIEIVETELSDEEKEERQERESLFVVTDFSKSFFINSLNNTDEGKTIGLSYFKERGYNNETITKFELGWSPEKRDALTQTALQKGYKLKFLERTGLSIVKRENNYTFDRFAGRVIFPIHALSGKVIGFGGRTLKSDKKTAKYLNSPESDIYHKSRTLYGIYFAKKSIVKEDKCIMVEGYTDVISLHQSGIENVVASSGTSLTVEQIRLVRRFTNNLTVIYDGDKAGIKASLRGIDLILAEEMNVKVVLLPDGEDPDSYSKKLNFDEFSDYIKENEKDFIKFKTELLLSEAKNDPVKRAGLTRDIVTSIAIIPDSILRSEYIKECSLLLDTREEDLYGEVRKILSKKFTGSNYSQRSGTYKTQTRETPRLPSGVKGIFSENDEKDIIYYLINYGKETISFDSETDLNETVAEFIISQMKNEELELINLVYKSIFEEYDRLLAENIFPNADYFMRHEDEQIRNITTEIISPKLELSKLWGKRGASIEMPEDRLSESVPEVIERFKFTIVRIRIDNIKNEIKTLAPEDYETKLHELLDELKHLDEIKIKLGEYIDKSALL